MTYENLLKMEFRPNHEIPFSRKQIATMLLENEKLDGEDVNRFKKFCRVLNSIYHFEFHDQLENLKNSYRNFNPDISEINNKEENSREALSNCFKSISMLLTEANYNEVSEKVIKNSLVEESIFPVSSEVNFEQFDTYKIFYQGESQAKTIVSTRIPFYKKEINFEFYNRVVLLFKVKELSGADSKRKVASVLKPGKLYLKYFRNIPKLDLEMIFPNPKPKMKLIDKLQIAIPLISGIGILINEFLYQPYVNKSVASPFDEGVSLVLLGILFALFGYAFNTYESYKFTIQSLLSEIAQSLYFKDIGNNEAVLTALVDAAEEEEGKEAILAYYFLLISSTYLSATQLDEKIEGWMKEKHDTAIDFEVSDGLKKLEALRILICLDGKNYSVPNLADTLKNLDRIWDGYFQYS